MEKFKKLKEFRDLDSLKLINEDKSTERLNEKFKDLQEIYTLIRTDIKTNSKNWIYSQKDETYYILNGDIFSTKILDGVFSNNINEKLKIIENISNNFKDRDIVFLSISFKILVSNFKLWFLVSKLSIKSPILQTPKRWYGV